MKVEEEEEEEGGKEAQAYASADKRGHFSVGTKPPKREEAEKCECGKQKDVGNRPRKSFIHNRSEPEHKHEKEAGHRSRDYPQVCVEEVRDKERIDTKKKKDFKRNAKQVDDDEGGKQGKGYAGRNKKRKDERMEEDNKGPAGERQRDMSGSEPGLFVRFWKRLKPQKKERKNLKRDKKWRGVDEAAQKKRRSSAKSHFGEGSEYEKRLGDGPEENWSRGKQNKEDAQCSQIRQSGRRRQAENQGNSSAGYEECDRKSQRDSEVRNREKTPQDTSKNRESIKRQSDPRPDERVTLMKGLSGINLYESSSPSRGEHAMKQNDTRMHGCFSFLFSKSSVGIR